MVDIIDTHAHLQSKFFEANLAEVVEASQKKGVSNIINCATCPADWGKILHISKIFPNLHPAIGVHPWYIPENYESDLDTLNLDLFKKCKAVGEIGLDKKYATTDIALQMKVFSFFISLAIEHNLPATVHCIAAYDELISVLKKFPRNRPPIILHAFNGSKELAKQLSKFNIYFSVGGVMTYKSNRKRSEMLNFIWQDLMMLESDSPDIPPVQKKEQANKPEYLHYTVGAIAQLTNKNVSEIAEKTTKLAKEIFKLN